MWYNGRGPGAGRPPGPGTQRDRKAGISLREIKNAIFGAGMLPVIEGESDERCREAAGAAARGGIRCSVVPFERRGAAGAPAQYILGVLCADRAQADEALGLGAPFAVCGEAAGGRSLLLSREDVPGVLCAEGGIPLRALAVLDRSIAPRGSAPEGIAAAARRALCEAQGFRVAHIGVNTDSSQEAEAVAMLFSRAFGFEYAHKKDSDFAGDAIEVMRVPGYGAKGHIAVETNDIERAIAHLTAAGFAFEDGSSKYDARGRRIVCYLAASFGGFAVHLLRRE